MLLVPIFGMFDPDQQTTCYLSLIHISEPTRRRGISYAVFCLKKKKRKSYAVYCLKKKKIKKKKKNIFFFFFLMIRRPPRSTPLYSSAASDVYKRQGPAIKVNGRLFPILKLEMFIFFCFIYFFLQQR